MHHENLCYTGNDGYFNVRMRAPDRSTSLQASIVNNTQLPSNKNRMRTIFRA
jgi:hypothetical protein